MPKRSNSFQRLVKLLHERLDDSWVVTESMMFDDSFTGEKREVDIVLESYVGSHKIVLSITNSATGEKLGPFLTSR